MAEPRRFSSGGARLNLPRAPRPETSRPRLKLPSKDSGSSQRGLGVDLSSRSPSSGGSGGQAAPKSLWQQISSLPGSAVQGSQMFLKEVWEAPRHLAQAGIDLATGQNSIDMSGNTWQDVQATFRAYTPLVADIASGVRGTLNVTGIGSEPNIIGRYQRAVEEGNWVDTALNDVANAAIVAGPVAKALGTTSASVPISQRSAALLRNTPLESAAQSVGSRSLRPSGRLGATVERPASLAGRALERPVTDSGFVRPTRIGAPDIPTPRTVSLQMPGDVTPRRLPVINDRPTLRSGGGVAGTDVITLPGKGLAGRLERRANPTLDPSIPAPASALKVERAGQRVRRVGLGAQYADPSDALLTVGGKIGKGLVTGKIDVRVPWKAKPLEVRLPYGRAVFSRIANLPKVQEWQEKVQQERGSQANRDQIEQNNAEWTRAAIKAQQYVDETLTKKGFDQTQRDTYGSVVLAELDRALDPAIEAYNAVEDPALRADILKTINEGRPDNAAITAGTIEAVNAYRSGVLDSGVREAINEGVTRAQRQIDDRTAAGLSIGKFGVEQLEVPRRINDGTKDGTPLVDLTPAERAEAFRVDPTTGKNNVQLPFLGSLVEAKRQGLLDEAGRLRTEELPARRAEMFRAAQELSTTEAMRLALPEPGTDVPDSAVPGFREELVNELVEERNALTEALRDRLDEIDPTDNALDEQIDAMVRTIEQLDEDIASLKKNYWDLSFDQMKDAANKAREKAVPKLKDLDDGQVVYEMGQQLKNDLHQGALDEVESFNPEGTPRIEPSGPNEAGQLARRLGNGEIIGTNTAGDFDVLGPNSPIWVGRRDVRFYRMKGWFSAKKKGLKPDDWFRGVRQNNPRMSNWSDMQIAEAYLDAVDRVYDTNRPAHLNSEVVDAVIAATDLDPEAAAAALRSPTAFRKEIRARVVDQVQYLSETFNRLPLDQRLKFIEDIRSLDELGLADEVRNAAFFDVLNELFDDARPDDPLIGSERDLFEFIQGTVDPDVLVKMLTDGEVSSALLTKIEDALAVNEQARSKAEKAIYDLEMQQMRRAAISEPQQAIRRSLSEALDTNEVRRQQAIEDGLALERDGELVADPVGTNPTPDGQWGGGDFNNNVVARADLVAEIEGEAPPRDNTRAPLSDAERLIEQETLRRKAYEDARRDVWVTEQKIAAAESKAANLERSLDKTKQQQIYETNRRSVARMQQIVRDISANELGGYEPADGPNSKSKLTGLVGKIASDLGLTDQLLKLLDDERRQLQFEYRADQSAMIDKPSFEEWARMRGIENLPERADIADLMAEYQDMPDQVKMSFETWLRRQSLDNEAGRMNLAVNHLVNAVGGPDGLGNWKGTLLEAVVAEDLARTLTPFYRDGLLVGREAYQALTHRFNELRKQPEYASVMGNDVETRILNEGKRALEALHRDLDQVNGERISMIPARFRTPVQEANRTVRAIMKQALVEWDKGTPEAIDTAFALSRVAEQAPTSFGALAMVVDATPQHIIGGTTLNGGVVVRTNQTGSHTAPIQETRSASQRTTGFRANTLREYARIEANEMSRILTQVAIGHIATNSPFVKSAYEAIPGAIAEWRATHAGQKMKYGDLRRLLEENGWAVVEGFGDVDSTGRSRAIRFAEDVPENLRTNAAGETMIDPQNGIGWGRLVDLDDPRYSDDLPAIRVMPQKMWEALREYQDPTSNRFVQLLDQTTQLWKTGTLAWSPAWVTYNAIGNAMMAGFSAGMSPSGLVSRLRSIRTTLRNVNEVRDLGGKRPLWTAMRNDTLASLLPGRINAHGLSWSEKKSTMSLATPDTRMGRLLDYTTNSQRSRIGAVTEFSYTLNEFTDNMFRSAVFLDQLEQRLRKDAQIPAEYLDSRGNIRTDLTEAQTKNLNEITGRALDAQEAAVRAALNTMGDFTRLTSFERKYVKRAFPFYPWLRHQTAMSLRMPLTNPLRWAWMQSLSDLLADPEEGEAVNALMAIMLGPVSLAAASPFAQGLTAAGSENEGKSIFDWRALGSALNPAIKVPLQLVSGIDIGASNAYSRPVDQKSTGVFGETLGTSALARILSGDVRRGLGEVGYGVLGANPQTRGLRDMALGAMDPRPRYDSGDVVPYTEAKPDNLLTQALRTARIPFVPSDISRRLEVAQERDREAARKNQRRLLLNSLRSGG